MRPVWGARFRADHALPGSWAVASRLPGANQRQQSSHASPDPRFGTLRAVALLWDPGRYSLNNRSNRSRETDPNFAPEFCNTAWSRFNAESSPFPVWSKYSNVLKSWVMAPAPNGLGKTLRTNSGPCNLVLRPFRMFSQEHRVQPATMIGFKQIEFFDHAGSDSRAERCIQASCGILNPAALSSVLDIDMPDARHWRCRTPDADSKGCGSTLVCAERSDRPDRRSNPPILRIISG
jgi:hypothetical protein